MVNVIQSDKIRVCIDTFGAQMQSVIVDGKERLWQNENGSWDGHAPVLFPFCGNCTMMLSGINYGRGFHGFASKKEFRLVEVCETHAIYELQDDVSTMNGYPFHFVFRVAYCVSDKELTITYTVQNCGEDPMYFACGGHESFALEKELCEYELVFDEDEYICLCSHDANGLLSGEKSISGTVRLIPLAQLDLDNNNTIIMKNVKSKLLWLREVSGEKNVMREAFPGFDNLLLWHPPGSKMICIEPWQNLPDYADGREKDFSNKEGVQCLAPSQMVSFTRTIYY